MRKIIIIDDEECLADIIAMMIEEIVTEKIDVKCISHWKDFSLDGIDSTSLVITDINGVGVRQEVPCPLILCSGDDISLKPELSKPFSKKDLALVMQKYNFQTAS